MEMIQMLDKKRNFNTINLLNQVYLYPQEALFLEQKHHIKHRFQAVGWHILALTLYQMKLGKYMSIIIIDWILMASFLMNLIFSNYQILIRAQGIYLKK